MRGKLDLAYLYSVVDDIHGSERRSRVVSYHQLVPLESIVELEPVTIVSQLLSAGVMHLHDALDLFVIGIDE